MPQENGADITDMAFRLSTTIPKLISVDFNPSASKNMIMASIQDVLDAMQRAKPADDRALQDPQGLEKWLVARSARDAATN